MYKLTVGIEGYSLFKLDLSNNKYKTLVKNSSIKTIEDYISKFLYNRIRPEELKLAIKDIEDTHYNTVEFGANGFYTIPLFDENVI